MSENVTGSTGPARVGAGHPGPTNSLHDIRGITVGHYERIGEGWRTGTTVVLAPRAAATGEVSAGEAAEGDATVAAGMVCGVDVRGGGPGTRETDLLDPRNMVERVHAVCLTGGSAFGLAAADGVMRALASDGIGLPMGGPGEVVPLVPAAVVFDLGRGGDYWATPDAQFGRLAYEAAAQAPMDEPFARGSVGAGTGAKAGGLKGGIGTASLVLPSGHRVAALVVCNALGEVLDEHGVLFAEPYRLAADGPPLRPPSPLEVEASKHAAEEAPGTPLGRPGMATTIGVVATDAALTKAQCAKLAGIAHDGLARAVRPVHTMFDGDTFFGASTSKLPAPDPVEFHHLLAAAADVTSRAVADAVLSATSPTPPAREPDAGTADVHVAPEWRTYRQAFPSAFDSGR